MRSAVNDYVPVGRPAALVSTFVDHLSVYRRAHPSLDVLALGLAHPTEHAHEHLVRRVTGVELSAQLGHPQADVVSGEPRRGQRELVAEPAPRSLPDYHGIPAPIG